MSAVARRRVRLSASYQTRSAAADLAWRPRARDEATSRGRLPWLVRLGFGRAFGLRVGSLGRRNWCFRCGLGPCGSGLGLVLRKTALLVFAARSATTGLVTSWPRVGLSSHQTSVLDRRVYGRERSMYRAVRPRRSLPAGPRGAGQNGQGFPERIGVRGSPPRAHDRCPPPAIIAVSSCNYQQARASGRTRCTGYWVPAAWARCIWLTIRVCGVRLPSRFFLLVTAPTISP
jgi:hypothetical protein